jgi:hypothetical protein
MVHCVLAVVQVPPPLEVIVINTSLMPVLVKVTDRVATARVTSAVFSVELVVNSADALVAYPVADPVRV